MITDINNKSRITVLDRSKLPSYWSQYFEFEKDHELYELCKTQLIKAIDKTKSSASHTIDSQRMIKEIFGEFNSKSLFHRKFNERYPHLHREQVLGMQLYHIMVEDDDLWTYTPTQHKGHLYPHAIYFK